MLIFLDNTASLFFPSNTYSNRPHQLLTSWNLCQDNDRSREISIPKTCLNFCHQRILEIPSKFQVFEITHHSVLGPLLLPCLFINLSSSSHLPTTLNSAMVDYSSMRPSANVIRSSLEQARPPNLVDVEVDGVSAIALNEHHVLIGNRKWISEKNFIQIPDDIENKLVAQEQLGRTALLAAIDGRSFWNSLFFPRLRLLFL